ncbi:unnamed protein product [Lampetra planeri]
MPAKAPIYLKPANNKKGKKCRLRDILSPDMISPPLGDFRHTIHIGRGGERDAFGDMSFLQGKYELLPGKGDIQPQYGIQGEFLRANSTGDASFAETPSPVLKNAISLPTIGGCQALTLPLISSTVFPVHPEPLEDIVGPTSPMKGDSIEEVEILPMDALLCSMDVFSSKPSSPSADIQSKPDDFKTKSSKGDGNLNGNCNGFRLFNNDIDLEFKQELSKCNVEWVDRDSGVEEGRICDFEFEFSKEKSTSQDSLAHITGSFLSLELDLGPSILDDVLNIMDKPAVKSRP